ncbi:uncharacterized protein LOC122865225 isoform X2 [Siniperca chuatsi]|uniref:uncharacterized protein LOC122865225 isoform X2 n=1 Tax=Siniperca chuatsi TaxID=119488 RepID=UPI001CE0EE60|nr:uncharacterized protein LOC122865225 isoform X2 [Siniperca chuatsi]
MPRGPPQQLRQPHRHLPGPCLLPKINYARNTGKVKRNSTKARLLTAQEMSDVILTHPRWKAQALARRDREQQGAKDTSLAATSSILPNSSRPSRRRRVPLGAASATSCGHPRSLNPLCPLLCLRRSPAACPRWHTIHSEPACSGTSPSSPVSRSTSEWSHRWQERTGASGLAVWVVQEA